MNNVLLMKNKLFSKLGTLTMLAIVSFSLFSPLVLAQTPSTPSTPQSSTPASQSTSTSDYHTFDLHSLTTKGQNNLSAISQSGQNVNPIAAFITRIINLIIYIAGSVSFLGVIIGGFFILSSAGNENRMNKGKEIITYAITGLVITLSAYFIVAFIQGIIFSGQ